MLLAWNVVYPVFWLVVNPIQCSKIVSGGLLNILQLKLGWGVVYIVFIIIFVILNKES